MLFPVPAGRVTVGYDQPRPLSVPPEQRDHVHGAIDIAAETGEAIFAPESGLLYYWTAFRPDRSRRMGELEFSGFPFDFAGRPYFYDIYGGIIVLLGSSGITHLFCHSFMNQLFNSPPRNMHWKYHESPKLERFPITAFYTLRGARVSTGATIGRVGNAGYSTGPHVHYEMHKGARWQTYNERPNPADFFAEVQV